MWWFLATNSGPTWAPIPSLSAAPCKSMASLIPWSESFHPGLFDRDSSQLTVPLVFKPEQLNHDFHWLLAIGRLKPGVTVKQAQADMDSVALRIAETYPKSDKGWGVFVEPLKNDFLPSERKQTLWLLLGAVGFILLIACVNVANLLLARGIARQKELAVRSALGASRRSIFEQLLSESLLLSLVGRNPRHRRGLCHASRPDRDHAARHLARWRLTCTSTFLSSFSLWRPLRWQAFCSGAHPPGMPRTSIPARHSRKADAPVVGAGRHRLRQSLVIGEFALALTLLTGAGLAIHSFLNLLRVDLGVRTDHVLTFFLPVPDSRPKDAEKIVAYRQILLRINAVPGVTSATAMTGLPLFGAGFGMPSPLWESPRSTILPCGLAQASV